MRYLILSSVDYANLGHRYADALTAVGTTAHDFTLSPHQFGYTSQSILVNPAYISSIYKNYDVIMVMHSCPYILSLVRSHPHIVVCHTGTIYRDNPEQCNEMFNPVIKFSTTDQPEFIHLGSKNLSYIAPHTTYSPIPKRDTGKLIVSHYPSNPDVKGTKDIERMLKPFHNDYEIRIDTTIVPHEQNIKRISESHIYIELFKPELNGKEYGTFGVTAFESAGLGCYTITQNTHEDVYINVYKSCFFRIANTEKEFVNVFETYRTLQPEDYRGLLTPKKFYENHSLHSTGYRLLAITQ